MGNLMCDDRLELLAIKAGEQTLHGTDEGVAAPVRHREGIQGDGGDYDRCDSVPASSCDVDLIDYPGKALVVRGSI